ncbi:lysine-specific demethylase JMJ17 isoform X3 [Nymphaea colorata]|uniref:lysine-specific demethylase JMJ17 isoform X3 n=1 Tax=Nymphaea colorata TaxID=210225 RepID=UPI00129D42F2|nr:lysine-specific demethylase JMJ17 isoform X3 [Nymphaea colorata]
MRRSRPRRANAASLCLNLPAAPAFYPNEDEFQNPLQYIDRIRPEAEPFGICRIVPPASWKPPFAIETSSFAFPTKSQAIHHLQARPAACDPDTFELEYGRFLEEHGGNRRRPRLVFRDKDLDLCRLYNAVKRYGGYDRVVHEKKWADVLRIVFPVAKVSPCSMHVLSQSYREHLLDYERYRRSLSRGGEKVRKWRTGARKSRKEKYAGGTSDGTKKRKRASDGEDDTEVGIREPDGQGSADQICEQCGSGLHGEVMLLCDRCDRGWHLYCLSPPLECVPAGNWYCLECVNSDKDSFGFVPGEKYTLDAFRRRAERVKRKWFGSTSPTHPQVEKRYWEILEGLAGEVQVIYGNDLDTSLYGSGFPRAGDSVPPSAKRDEWKAYSESPWNLNNLPKLKGSMLRAVRDSITGVTVPWLYVGMLFSSFCWHVEDHCFYSMNYLHWGDPKCWYSVPGSEAHAFEKVMRKVLPDLFEAQPDLLFQLVTMLNPSVLQENGVNVYKLVQEPGNFVITFPKAFHAGFNCGLNCAEAVNFAPADWLPHGGIGAELYRLYHKTAVLSHEELVYVAAKVNNYSKKTAPYLKEEMLRIFVKEKSNREALWKKGLVKSSPMCARNQPEFVGTEENPSCIICQQYLFISAVVCGCSPCAFVCLEHFDQLCECSPNKRCLLYRYTLAELNDFLSMGKELGIACCLDSEPHQKNKISCDSFTYEDTSRLMKKIKGHNAYFSQLAKDWLTVALSIHSNPFSEAAAERALSEAEQFLWSGHEVDPVRDMVKSLLHARSWSQSLRTCLGKVENCVPLHDCSAEKVPLKHVEDLLDLDPLPCNEPSYHKLKGYAEDAKTLRDEIVAALAADPHTMIAELECLLAKVLASPIEVEESNIIGKEISSAKDFEVNVSLEDHFVQMPKETDTIACDSGAVAGDDVLKLIKDGENLPVNCDKELSLDSSSILYCICRKPYDERPMIACDQCDEWYHFDCINLQGPPPDKFFCRACEPVVMDLMCTSLSPDEERALEHADDVCYSTKLTPTLLHVRLKGRRRPRKARSTLQLRLALKTDSSEIGASTSCSELDKQWRKNRKLCRRTARRRIKFETLSLFVHMQ